MAKASILIIEDSPDIRELIRYNLSREGYETRCAERGVEGLSLIEEEIPGLVLLDLMLPDMDGLDICRHLREQETTRHLPIIMVTAKGEETDIVTGLELGADDYVTKPFRPRELLARVRAVLRRFQEKSKEASPEIIRLHDLAIHPGRHEVKVAGTPVKLTFTEFGVLLALAKRPGWVLTRYQIVDAVRGEHYVVTDRAVDVQIAGLRKKLGAAGRYIETVRGIGYRFMDESA